MHSLIVPNTPLRLSGCWKDGQLTIQEAATMNVWTVQSTQHSTVFCTQKYGIPNKVSIYHLTLPSTRADRTRIPHKRTSPKKLRDRNRHQAMLCWLVRKARIYDATVLLQYMLSHIKRHMDTPHGRKYVVRWNEYYPRERNLRDTTPHICPLYQTSRSSLKSNCQHARNNLSMGRLRDCKK